MPPASSTSASSPNRAASSDDVARAPGLRERTKAKRRALIQRTAMRLFAERGFEHTTLADIAEEAEVAVRTVTGYFPSKLALATSFADAMAVRLKATVPADLDTGKDLVDVLEKWVTEEEQAFDPELMRLTDAMWVANPDLRALANARFAEVGSVGRAAILAGVGLPADDPIMELCIAAVEAVVAAHFIAFMAHEPSPERHNALVTYLRAIIDAAKPAAAA